MIDRRRFLIGSASVALTALGPVSRSFAAGPPGRFYVGARTTRDGRHGVAAFDDRGRGLFDTALPDRAHGVARDPRSGALAVFARRPGRFVAVLDPGDGRVLHRIEPAPGRNFYGHGAYSPDGTRLFTTENAYESGRGVIGVFDATDYRRIGEFPSGGIGPHEIRLMPDGRTLAVANGGIRTHPDMDRIKLNLHDMRSNLALLGLDGTPRRVAEVPAAMHRNSLRHIDVAPDGTIVAALQFQGPLTRRPPLAMILRPGGDLTPLPLPDPILARMRNYCGSASVDATGTSAAISAPRGGLVAFWRLSDGAYRGHLDVPDGCGVAADGTPGGFLVTSGAGGLRRRGGPAPDTAFLTDPHWDNHLIAVIRG